MHSSSVNRNEDASVTELYQPSSGKSLGLNEEHFLASASVISQEQKTDDREATEK